MMTDQLMTLVGAINSLDPDNDEHWTKLGEPAMSYIEAATGREDLKRADVDAMTPDGFKRSNAHTAPTLKGAEYVDPDPSVAAAAELEAFTAEMDAAGVEAMAAVEAGFGSRTPGEVAADAIALMEAAVAASQSPRYMRNSTLQTLIRGYQANQHQIKELQARLDARMVTKKVDALKAKAAA